MQRRAFLIILAATIILVAGAVATVIGGDRSVSLAAVEAPALPTLAAKLGTVARVQFARGAFNIGFARAGKRWLVVAKGDYPAAAGRVPQVLLALADLTLVDPKTNRPALYPRLSVADPQSPAGAGTLVTIADKAGATIAALIIGKQSFDQFGVGSSGVYVRRPGAKRSWLARGKLDVSGGMASWLDRGIVDISDSRIATLTLTTADGTALTLDRAKPDAPFAVASPPADAKFKSQTVLAEPANALEGLELDDVAPQAALAVPDKGVATASFTTFHGLTIRVRLFSHGKRDWAAFAATATGTGSAAAEAAKINDKVAKWCYAIPSYKAKMMQTRLASLIAPAKGS